MINKSAFTKVLAVIGTCLVCFPIFATFITSIFGSIRFKGFRFDYLMPAELGLFALVGGGLLIWASLRAQVMRKPIIWCLICAFALLIGSQGLAVVTGLASGESEMVGWKMILVIVPLVGYSLAIIIEGIFGILLLRRLNIIKSMGDFHDDQKH